MHDDTKLFVAECVGEIHSAIKGLEKTLSPGGVALDAAGNNVGTLTEAVMGITDGLCRVADAIDGLAIAIESRKTS